MQPGRGKKVVVAMSGGVDSSVAAALLLEQGYQVVGCFMRLGSEDSAPSADACENPESLALPAAKPGHQGCCSLNDAADARLVAAMLGTPFYVLNFKKDFERIIDYFVGEYNTGRTPNPCVRCNDWLKFGKLAAFARSIDADYIATGHYARVNHQSDRPQLLRGVDPGKDQSYVLFGTRLENLRHMLLPIGAYHKQAVRQMAEQRGLPIFNKPDSQEICFVPDNDYVQLIRRRTPRQLQPGPILDANGKVVGTHEGHQHFTIGQRRGVKVALGHPLYVTGKDPRANTVTVGLAEDLAVGGLNADQTNWLIDPPLEDRPCQIKIRYNSSPVPGTVRATAEDALEVRFTQPVSAVTPGQAVVCYDGQQLIGGGWIRVVHHHRRSSTFEDRADPDGLT